MKIVLIGNIIGLLGSIAMVISTIIKEKKKILISQSIQLTFLTISNLILNSLTGALVNIVSIIRNILTYKNKLNKVYLSIIILLTISTLFMNNRGLIGLIPVIATTTITLGMLVEDDRNFKIIILVAVILWSIHDYYIKSYTTFAFDLFSILGSGYSIIKQSKSINKK